MNKPIKMDGRQLGWRANGTKVQYYISGSESRTPRWQKLPQTEQVARLTAAAPEMLEALRTVLSNRRLLNDEHFSGVSDRLFSRIREIIEKAENGE